MIPVLLRNIRHFSAHRKDNFAPEFFDDFTITPGTISQEIKIDDRSVVGLVGKRLKKLFVSIDLVNTRLKSPGWFF